MSDERLWAPWRMAYIKGPKAGECVFCAEPARGEDEASGIVHRGERCYVMLNAYPYTNGHLMISPYLHTATIEGLDEETLLELMTLGQSALAALREAYRPDGFNLGLNLGKVAGAGFDEHLHLHVVPRWAADSNFMPVIGNARVLPELLHDSFLALRAAWPRAFGSGDQPSSGT
jgi:ATP adenylyltransferase